MSDIITELRERSLLAEQEGDPLALLDEAADEIERLKGYRDEAESDAAIARLLVDKLRLTDAEREAILYCVSCAQDVRDTISTTEGDGEQRVNNATLHIGIAMNLAMLRERERTNHDAVPAARAAEPESPVPLGSVAAPENTHTLADAEREAVQRAMASIADTLDYASQQAAADYATLRVLLERTSGTHATPAQGSVQGR